jgi:putative hydrolase of the HAD superfamily
MDDLLKELKKRYPLYLISNTNEMHFNHIKSKYKILRHFKKTFPSHKMGHRKPEREIYEKVLAQIGLKPEETVFIDDVPQFVEGARKAGMRAVRFRNQKQLLKDLARLGI